MPMKEFVDKKIKIGLFDSGIGGFSILQQLFKVMPNAEFYYFSDDANAPYGPKSDEFITERADYITNELFKKNVDLIVVACNTATASSIDHLREIHPDRIFVGVEPYLNAYYKMPDGPKNVGVLTTESTGKSERFKRLKERLDPNGNIIHMSLPNLAKLIEDFYFKRMDQVSFLKSVDLELAPVKNKKFTHAILGCTHYPLIREYIEQNIGAIAISPCKYVALRVCELLKQTPATEKNNNIKFYFYSSSHNQWEEREEKDSVLPLK